MTIAAFGNTKSDSVKVYFRVGQHVFDPTLRNNRAVMDSFVNIVREANIEDRVEDLTVRCYASQRRPDRRSLDSVEPSGDA